MDVPVVAVPFPVVIVQTVTVQAPVSGGASVDQTTAAAGQPGGGAFVVVAA